MADGADHSEAIANFVSITDAAPHVAESYLESCNFEFERAVDLYFSGNEPPPAPAPAPAPRAAAPPPDDDYVEIMDDDDDDGAAVAELARQRASALAARQAAEQQQWDDDDDDDVMLAGAGAAAAPGPAAARLRARPAAPAPEAMDLTGDNSADDADLQAVAAAVAAADGGGGGDVDADSFHRRQQQQLLAHYQAQAAAAAVAGGADDMQPAPGAAGGGGGEGADGFPLDLPEGINLEEARMLEAAMLGVPYQGRIPDFNAAPAPAAPLSPGALEQRSLRQEQDEAYEESLALDRAKQESIAAAAAAAEAAQQQQAEAEAAAAAQAEAAASALATLLATKRERLPPEPPAGEAGSLQVVVRLPSGVRKGRRFRGSDPLAALFDFVDVEAADGGRQSDAAGRSSSTGGGEEGALAPGSYRLVSQFPRRVLSEDDGGSSMADAGLSADCALFVESV